MNHTHAKRVILPIAALLALFVLFSVGIGVSASASRGPTAGSPCCERHAPSQATFPMRLPIAGTPCCQHYAPSQVAFQSSRTSGRVPVATTARSRGSTATQAT